MIATTDTDPKDKLLDHIPPELMGVLTSHVQKASILEVAPHDLDRTGRYCDGFLVLVLGRLGSFTRTNGAWTGSFRPISDFGSAAIVEGIGMGLLRLLRGEQVIEEYRFSLRHAKQVAKLQRRLEHEIDGSKEWEVEGEKPKPDEKKIRCEKCDRVIPPWSEVCPSCLSRRKVLSRLMDFVKPYRLQAGIGLTMAIITALAMLVRPYLSMPMINDGLGLGEGKSPSYDVLLFYIFIMAGTMFVAAIGEAIRQRLMAKLGSKIARDVRDQTYAHMHKLSLSFFSGKPTGSLITRITSDSDRIWDFVAFTVIEFVVAMLTIVGVGVALFVLNWRLACLVLIPIPLMMVMMFIFHRRMHGFFHRIFHRWSRMTAVVSDAIPGVRVIKAFSQEKREVDRFSQRNNEVYEGEMEMINLWTMFGPVLHLFSQIGALLVWIIGGYWAVTGQYGMNAGILVAYIGYMWMFYGPIHMLSHMDRLLNRAATSVQRIFEVLDTQPAIYSKTGAAQASAVKGSIELRNVSFSYDGIRKVLKNVSLKIEPGTMVGLAGPSGGGKTTLINMICRFYDVLEGQILIDGVDVRDYEVESLRRKIGVVLQDPFLFYGTVARNIAYGNPDATMEQIIAAAKAANAHDFIVGFPDGYDTMVGERGHTLSGGERQRISIARAVLNNPTILILDEATSSVDTETEKLIQEALDRLIAHRTTIAIAHRLSTLRKADRLVVLDKGKVVEEGSHEELLAKPDGQYAKLIQMQNQMQSIIAIG